MAQIRPREDKKGSVPKSQHDNYFNIKINVQRKFLDMIIYKLTMLVRLFIVSAYLPSLF